MNNKTSFALCLLLVAVTGAVVNAPWPQSNETQAPGRFLQAESISDQDLVVLNGADVAVAMDEGEISHSITSASQINPLVDVNLAVNYDPVGDAVNELLRSEDAELAMAVDDTAMLAAQKQPMEDAFNGEGYDAQWAPTMEAEVWQDFERAELPHSQLASVACRTSLCRIEITHDDQTAEAKFMLALFDQAPTRKGSFYPLGNASDGLATLVFLSR